VELRARVEELGALAEHNTKWRGRYLTKREELRAQVEEFASIANEQQDDADKYADEVVLLRARVEELEADKTALMALATAWTTNGER